MNLEVSRPPRLHDACGVDEAVDWLNFWAADEIWNVRSLLSRLYCEWIESTSNVGGVLHTRGVDFLHVVIPSNYELIHIMSGNSTRTERMSTYIIGGSPLDSFLKDLHEHGEAVPRRIGVNPNMMRGAVPLTPAALRFTAKQIENLLPGHSSWVSGKEMSDLVNRLNAVGEQATKGILSPVDRGMTGSAAESSLSELESANRPAFPGVPPRSETIDFEDINLWATRDELVAAFQLKTGLNSAWFKNLKDVPALKRARKRISGGGRGAPPTLYCPYEVMVWLKTPSGRISEQRASEEGAGWKILKRHFPKAFEQHGFGIDVVD